MDSESTIQHRILSILIAATLLVCVVILKQSEVRAVEVESVGIPGPDMTSTPPVPFTDEQSLTQVRSIPTLPAIPEIALRSKGESVNSLMTSEQAAQSAARHVTEQARLGLIPQWKGADLGNPVEHYDLDANVSAYVFPVLKERQDVGYVVIDSTPIDDPVIEFSAAKARFKISASDCRTAARKKGFSINTAKPLYLGPLSYYYEMLDGSELYTSTESIRHVIDMASVKVITLTEKTNNPCRGTSQIAVHSTNHNLDSTPSSAQAVSIDLTSYGYVNGVPSNYDRNWTRQGCYLA